MGARVLAITTATVVGGGLVSLVLMPRVVPLPEGFFDAGSRVVAFRDGTSAHVFLSPDEKWRIRVPLSEVDPTYLRALLAMEDKRFYSHPGVDPLAVVRALVANVSAGRVVSGASTITMQLVRVREPRPRTVRSKVVEVFRALQIEARYDKREILEAYLQYAPFGRNIEGVEAAALAYFGHRARALSPAEIAVLLAVPQSPTARMPSAENLERLTFARTDIARRLAASGVFGEGSAQVLEAIEGTEVPRQLRAMPRRAPHAALWLVDRAPLGRDRVVSTLDPGVQAMAERLLTRAQPGLSSRGIFNAALVVIDHRRREVAGLVGNPDFWDDEHGGQIPSFDVPRSPGSALKPFIYVLAIERGLLLPEHALTDTPRSYGPYSPRNYDGKYRGLVKAEDALSQSLNVPFVELLGRIGVDRFVSHLRLWGATTLEDDPGHYGLSAAVGGVELTPIEIGALYAVIAENGQWLPLRFVLDDSSPQPNDDAPAQAIDSPSPRPRDAAGFRAFSSGAAYLARRALKIRDRPDMPERRRYARTPANIHWKTGTSYGHRDAWAVGSNARYTAVVWLGNLDNRPSVHLVGADAAGPILFDLLEGLESSEDASAFDPIPSQLRPIEVCSLSGLLPGPSCPHRTFALGLPQRVPTAVCSLHVTRDVDVTTGLALSPSCRSGRRYRTEHFVLYPPSLRRYLRDESLRVLAPPSFAPGCEAETDVPPRIIDPPHGQVALLIPGMSAERQEIPLVAESASARVSWFVDGEYLGTVSSEERMWWRPELGRHEFVVVDDAGRSARRTLSVRAAL